MRIGYNLHARNVWQRSSRRSMTITLGDVCVVLVVVVGGFLAVRSYYRMSASAQRLDMLVELRRREVSGSWSNPPSV